MDYIWRLETGCFRGLKGGRGPAAAKQIDATHFCQLVETVGAEEVAGYVADVSRLAYHLVIHFLHFTVGDLTG